VSADESDVFIEDLRSAGFRVGLSVDRGKSSPEHSEDLITTIHLLLQKDTSHMLPSRAAQLHA